MRSIRSRHVIPVVATVVLLIIATVAVVQGGFLDGDDGNAPVSVATDSSSRLNMHDLRSLVADARRVEPEAAQFPASSGAPIARVVVQSAGIEAPVIPGYVDPNSNIMIAPQSAYDVAWYEYSAPPGQGGNAVFAGHVDYIGVGPAVFWNLRALTEGDIIEIHLTDGMVLKYRVEFNEVYSAANGPWNELFGEDVAEDVVTLYTCDGAFDGAEYSDRRVVRADRIA